MEGEAGRLIYRGYSIEDLAQRATFEETVYLLWEGRLPTRTELDAFTERLAAGRVIPTVLHEHMRLIPSEAHPLGVLRSAVSLLAHHDPDVESMDRARTRAKAERLIGQIPNLVASWARIREGKAPVAPRADLSAASNFMYMLTGEEPDATTAKAMDVAFTLHAEHEFNASTFGARVAAGTFVDLHSSLVAAISVLKGPRHGGANEDVIEVLQEIGDPARAEAWTRDRLARRAAASPEQRADPNLRFPGIGHAVYRTLDPRARQLMSLAADVAQVRGVKGIAEIQATIRKIVEEELHLFPNVDYYSAGLYYALGIPTDLYTSIFAIARTAGWVAHIEEQLWGGRLIRPRAEYTGPRDLKVKPIGER